MKDKRKDKRILLIQNSSPSGNRLADELKACGFAVLQTERAQTALDHICGEPVPDIVLIDQTLISMDAVALLREIRDHFTAQQLPVLILASHQSAEAIVEQLDAGANDTIALPINFPVLVARMGVWLNVAAATAEMMRKTEERVVTESLGAACHHLAQPATVAMTEMEIIISEHPEMQADLRDSLNRVASQLEKSGQILHRLQRVSAYQTEPYAGSSTILYIAESPCENSLIAS
jgi:DNA-binding response OmpR family regulator